MDHLCWFVWYEPLLLPSYSYWHFLLGKMWKRNSYSESRVIRMRHFWAQNGSFAPNCFFWEKLLSFSSTYWPLSFCKILKKFFELIQSCEDVPSSDLPWTKCFGANHYYYFHLYIGPFHEAKFKKYSYNKSRVMRTHHFWAQNGPLAPNKIFFLKKIIDIIFIYLLAPFVVQNFKQILTADPEFWGCISFGRKIAHLPKW